jgi:hypothetical protein
METTLKQVDVMRKVMPAEEHKSRDAKEILSSIKRNAEAWVRDPWFQTLTISTGSGAVVLGSVGGAFGTASGIVIGTTVGAFPALFTFGLSLPFGAAAGGCLGFGTGTTVGSIAGGVCGGAAGHSGYRYRVQIKKRMITVSSKIASSAENAKLMIVDTANHMKTGIETTTLAAKEKTISYVSKSYSSIDATARDRRVQVSAVSAAAGAAVGAPVGGFVGACSGAVLGGAVGLVPALFTFGLSVPFGAVVGGSLGLCTGTVGGGSVAAVGSGSIAYGAYTYQEPILEKAEQVQQHVIGSAENIKAKAIDSYSKAREVVSARLSGTGGTA